MSLVMVRTVCCETYKCTGERCAICPGRPENRENVRQYLQQIQSAPLGRRLGGIRVQPQQQTAAATPAS